MNWKDDMGQKYITGTPSYQESNSLWKRNESDSDVTSKEFEEAFISLSEHIKKWCPILEGLDDGFCYIRGDNFGDRTHYLEIGLPELVNIDFIHYLQKWLNEFGEKNWRIFIPTYLTDAEAIMIYPSVIAIGRGYRNRVVNDVLLDIAKMMRQNDKRNAYLPKQKADWGVFKSRSI